MLRSLLFSAVVLTTHAAKHHFFVGTYGTPAIYGVEFDNIANSLRVVENNTTRSENEWLALSYDAKTLYSSGASGWSSFNITSPTTLGLQSNTTPTIGDCNKVNGVYVLASRKAPYSLYGSLACANWIGVGPTGEVGKATPVPYNEAAVIYGMALDPTNTYLYSSDWKNGKIWTHRIKDDGSLELVGSTDAPSNVSRPRSIQVHPSGKSLYVLLESWNVVAYYTIDSATHLPKYSQATYPIIASNANAGSYGAQSAALSTKGSILWVTAHSRTIGQSGYLSGFRLDENGLPLELLFQVTTPNSGGKALNVASSPFAESTVALTESEKGSVSVWQYKNATAVQLASVDIVDAQGPNGGCCSDVQWLD
ncbi:3-carboxy-cis,cis-mucoante lactonizing enzyme [Tothia fuscella]|uniref:3-carboxy-cis,cis-mucoante lactonizing enzyme n=1 Tax=Tothia fuscella TaxID=1048955 RepID=A0A9P4NLE9_9PEZI|nr:3-carboxy-cis,cis-mucoante lactonizing enzyme [Tothia fuscella]